jgi:hypothetical protein
MNQMLRSYEKFPLISQKAKNNENMLEKTQDKKYFCRYIKMLAQLKLIYQL